MLPVRQDRSDPGEVGHLAQAVGGVALAQGDVRPARLEDGEDRHHQFGGAFHQEPDGRLGRHAEADEPARQGVGAGVERRVVVGGGAAADGDGVRGAPGLGAERLGQARLRYGRLRAPAEVEDGPPLTGGEGLQAAQRQGRVRGDRAQHAHQPVHDGPRRPFRDQVGLVVEPQAQPPRPTATRASG